MLPALGVIIASVVAEGASKGRRHFDVNRLCSGSPPIHLQLHLQPKCMFYSNRLLSLNEVTTRLHYRKLLGRRSYLFMMAYYMEMV